MDNFTPPSAAPAFQMAEPASAQDARGINSPPVKTRTACNRCHAQKLKCVREPGQIKCGRCARLRTPCRFSPRAPRAAQNAPEQVVPERQILGAITTPAMNIEPDSMYTDIRDNDCLIASGAELEIPAGRASMFPNLCDPLEDISYRNIFTPPTTTCSAYQSIFPDFNITPFYSDTTPSPTPNLSSCIPDSAFQISTYSSTSYLSTVQQIANLNVALHSCASKLPIMTSTASSSAPVLQPPTAATHSTGTPQSRLFAISELLDLTSQFISITRTFNSSPIPNHLNAPNLSPDEATLLMLLSCHHRIAEIYEKVFTMMQYCINFSLPPNHEEGWAVEVPKIEVGGVEVEAVRVDIHTQPNPEIASMYMLMLCMLSAQLWSQISDVMRLLAAETAIGRDAVMDAMWAKVKARNEGLVGIIGATRGMMRQAG